MSSEQHELKRKARAEGAVEVLEHLKEALCSIELSGKGRKYVDKMLVRYRKQAQ